LIDAKCLVLHDVDIETDDTGKVHVILGSNFTDTIEWQTNPNHFPSSVILLKRRQALERRRIRSFGQASRSICQSFLVSPQSTMLEEGRLEIPMPVKRTFFRIDGEGQVLLALWHAVPQLDLERTIRIHRIELLDRGK
jgi:hypothetical protein